MIYFKMTREAYLAAKAAGTDFEENDLFIEGYSSEYGEAFINMIKLQTIPSLNKNFFVCEKQLVNNYFEKINNA
jgi:hypothetical protein